jgi:hypothetical protein
VNLADADRIERQLKLIRARIAGRRPNAVPRGGADIERLVDDAARLARVNSHWGIAPSWPVAGRIEVLGKRAIRILLRWYINPIVDQQNDFNAAVVRALYELESEVEALRVEVRDSEFDVSSQANAEQ